MQGRAVGPARAAMSAAEERSLPGGELLVGQNALGLQFGKFLEPRNGVADSPAAVAGEGGGA